MAELAAIASIGSAALSLGGGLAGAAGQRVAGSVEKTRQYLAAQEMRRKANDVEAATDRTIRNMNEDGDRVISAQRAALASQGVDTASTGAVDLQGNVAGKVAKEATYERGKGIQQAADLILGAGQAEAAGDAAKRAASMQSLGTIIGSVGSAVGSLAGGGSRNAGSGAIGSFSSWLRARPGGGGGGLDWGGGTGQPLNIRPGAASYG